MNHEHDWKVPYGYRRQHTSFRYCACGEVGVEL